MKKFYPLLLLIFLAQWSQAQVYDDYIGTGNFLDVTTSSSDPSSDGMTTVNGDGYELDIQGASRFLARASMGATMEEIKYVSEVGMEAWIEEQIALPGSMYTEPTIELILESYDRCIETLGEDCDFTPLSYYWRFINSDILMKNQDRLRQRVAQSLSEILVVSDQSELINYPHGLASYYDVLSRNAFGNYRDLLMEITLHPVMGFYLSHFNNPKSDPSINRRPDENYAREIMQLFSIGLYELNNDGSRKLDADGLWIPTYDNDDIAGLAKVFTGLSGSAWEDPNNTNPVRFGFRFAAYSKMQPMAMYEFWHEQGPKTIIGDYTIPAGQTGMEDIEDAVDHLFNHPNVGPFLALRLIQRLVKSNPSPDYINRVASIFNNNGNGVRGDLEAMIKAILLDQEALECYWEQELDQGQLRSPGLRYAQLVRGLKAETEAGVFWNAGLLYQNFTGHHTLSAPSVFNFYMPDYSPNVDFDYYEFVGPEYQILNSSTSSNYVNWMLVAIHNDYLREVFGLTNLREFNDLLNENFYLQFAYVRDRSPYAARLTDAKWLSLAEKPEEIVDYLDLLLANGHMSDDSKLSLSNSLKNRAILNPFNNAPKHMAHHAAFLMMIHPEYVIMK